jgi:hypothetical protein
MFKVIPSDVNNPFSKQIHWKKNKVKLINVNTVFQSIPYSNTITSVQFHNRVQIRRLSTIPQSNTITSW